MSENPPIFSFSEFDDLSKTPKTPVTAKNEVSSAMLVEKEESKMDSDDSEVKPMDIDEEEVEAEIDIPPSPPGECDPEIQVIFY